MAFYADVAFPIPLDRTFTYSFPEGIKPSDRLGCRVSAPFGKKTLVGYVVGETILAPAFTVKPIYSLLDDQALDPSLLELARWTSSIYLCSLGEAMACILPTQLKAPKRELKLARSEKQVASSEKVEARVLTEEQAKADAIFDKTIDQKQFAAFLLRGITDSGKTELYFRSIDRILARGQQAIYLVPEIVLTPPFIEQLEERYGSDRVGLWHSGLTPGQRHHTYERVRMGELSILLGARSAVFAPFPNLGIIIIDEEHEPSYKQEDRPRYHAREVALERAHLTSSIVIMGSATPSLESYWKAREGIYQLVELSSRVGDRPLPNVTLIDRRPPKEDAVKPDGIPAPKKKRRFVRFDVLTETLRLATEQRLARGEQIMLFINRRGYTPFLRCSSCGWVARCTRCCTTLTMHLKNGKADLFPTPAEGRLMCHVCVRAESVPTSCQQCKGMRLRSFGVGTQRVEEEIKRLFPFIRLARLDRDIGTSRVLFEKIYSDFKARKLDMLIGTQMIAKGFDFPSVTLVGVIDADVSLHLPDFRASERTFELVAQVAGRAGRGERRGQVLVQTNHPDHYALRHAQQHDYLSFYHEEIGHRQSFSYPPFSRLVSIVIRSTKESVALQEAETLGAKLVDLGHNSQVLGPAPAPYSRIRDQFRYQIVLRAPMENLIPYLDFLRRYKPAKAFMAIDVDPIDLL